MDISLIVLLAFLGLLATWGIVEAVLSVRWRRRVERDPRAVWRGGRKMLPEDAKKLKSPGGSSGDTSARFYDSGIH